MKVYQKELYRRPQMWSSNAFLVFKPDEEENKGPEEGDSDAEEESGEDGEGGEAAINAEEKKDFERLD